MEGVSFDAERTMETPKTSIPQRKGVAATLVRVGIVKTEEQANGLLIVVALLLLLGTVFLFIQGTRETRVDLPPLPVSNL